MGEKLSPRLWFIEWYSAWYEIEGPDSTISWRELPRDIQEQMPTVQEHRGWPNFEVALDKVKAFIRGENSL